jgi:hypothetical protein
MTLYYSDDFIELHHGDCREITQWLTCDVLVTDPPYGISWMKNEFASDKTNEMLYERDERHKEETSQMIMMCQPEMMFLSYGARLKQPVVFGTWRKPRPENTSHRLIWHKLGRYSGVNPNPWYPNDEEIYLIGKGWVGKPTPTVIMTDENRSNHARNIGHPTPKPVGLMETLISKCPPGSIADPFAGSGATLIAARNQKRNAIGVEIDETYCELIANRLSQDVLL